MNQSNKGALTNVRVLDLTHYIAGPFCTRLLADYGADVIKIEKPGTGDPARNIPPFYKDEKHLEMSGLFLYLNTNKRSLTLNLKSEAGRKILLELVRSSDVLVENFSPRVMPSLGISYETLCKANPKLVMTSISNFGQYGAYRDFKASELVLYGLGHAMHSSGLPDREPIKMWGYVNQFYAGLIAAVATLIFLFSAGKSGQGEHIDISIQETELTSVDRMIYYLLSYQYTGKTSKREEALGWGLPYPVGIASDGFFFIGSSMINWNYFVKVCEMMGKPELAKDPRFSTRESHMDPQRRDEFEAIWMSWTTQHTKQDIFLTGQKSKVITTPMNTVADLLNDPHLRERGYWVELNHAKAGKVKSPGALFKSSMPWEIKTPAPLLGEHTTEVLAGLGYNEQDLIKFRQDGVI